MAEYALNVDYGKIDFSKNKEDKKGEKHLMAYSGENVFIWFHLNSAITVSAGTVELQDGKVIIQSKGLEDGYESAEMTFIGASTKWEGSFGAGQTYAFTIQVADL